MTAPNLPFSRDEYDRRLARTRAAMERAGIEVLVVVDPSNMAWLTGYDGWSFYVHQAVIVGPDGPPLWWGRGMDAPGARRTVWMDESRVLEYADELVMNPPAHPMTDLADRLADMGHARARIGVEKENYYYTARAHEVLAASLPEARLIDATGLVNWQRIVKSPAELDFMAKAARIVEAMHARILEVAEPGLRKNELVAEIMATAIRGVDGAWGDYPAIVPLTPSGLDATAAHLTWDDRPLKRGEMTFFEIAGVYRRYHVPQCRTLYLGTPPEKYRAAEAAVCAGMEAGIAAARPGATCEEVAVAFYDELARHGFAKDSRCGYPIGLSYPPDWGERTASFRRGDRTELAPGMCFHFMTGLWLDDGGLEITEPIVITEHGAECLCTTPRQLFVKD